jgi:16S rRNA processing protein RimM
VGCRLEGADGTVVGTVRGIWQTGAHDVLVVESDAGVERLVPAAEELLREVDLPGRRIVVEIPPGLLDGE